MASVLAPYGLRPAYRLGAVPYNGGFSKIKIYSNETTPIYNGDVTQIRSTSTGRGHVIRCNATVTATTVTSSGTFNGVLVGCEYTDPNTNQKLQRHNYPGAIVASDIYGFIVDDPSMVFRVMADGAVPQTAFGCNGSLIQTAVGNTTTLNSGLCFQASSIATTSTLPLRIVGFVNDPNSSVNDTYTELYVRINNHFNTSLTGTQAT